MRFTGGWIKLHRQIDGNWISSDSYALSIFVTLLMWANIRQSTTIFRGKKMAILPGQILTSAAEISAKLGISSKTVFRRLKMLKDDGIITTKESSRGTIVTLVNWESYQNPEEMSPPASPSSVHQPVHQPGRSCKVHQPVHLIEEVRIKNKLSPNGDTQNSEESSSSVSSPSVQKFISIWNAHRGVLPACQKLSESRRRKIKVRLNEQPEFAYWERVVKKMATSAFCCSGKWATIDWLISNDNNHVKVVEGKYDNVKSQVADSRNDPKMIALAKKIEEDQKRRLEARRRN